ncbi:Intraflagellar transport protein 74 [Cichlidogyrus casuarinus]|uniref:Intraflagellar transport protein 74 n=1 Tax=Cichlidogyrus casuarinus TaxID=1844966 RepID=A0ABD2QN49_9PLAT
MLPKRVKTGDTRGNMGTASRLTTGMKSSAGKKQSAGIMKSSLNLQERPITQQGLSGVKMTSGQGRRRQVEDKSHYIGLVRRKMNEIEDEIKKISVHTEELETVNASYLQYEQMAEELASHIEGLQGELGDYNTLVEKAGMGGDAESVQLDLEDLKEANQRFERNLVVLFESRQDKEATVEKLEIELDQDRQLAESVLHDMKDTERERYLSLKVQNESLINQLKDAQVQMENLNSRKIEFEQDLADNQTKQECLKLYAHLRKLQAKRDQLQAEDASFQDPQLEKDRLLNRVKEDNQEIAQMEKEIYNLEERAMYLEEQIEKTRQGTYSESVEKIQKLEELKKQEQQIDAFADNFETARHDEEVQIEQLQEKITGVLTRLSKNHATLEEPVNTSPGNLEADQKKGKLQTELFKVDQLEKKLKEEQEKLSEKIASMEQEMRTFSDLDTIRVEKNERKKQLLSEKEVAAKELETVEKERQLLDQKVTKMQRDLDADETYSQIKNLEKRWCQLEQVNHALSESLESKRELMDYSSIRHNVEQLLSCYNQKLIQQLN